MYIRSLAKHRNLYTVFSGDEDNDDFEHWLTTNFEVPGNEAIEKALLGARLSRNDWHALARYFAAQDLRTPQGFISLMKRAEEGLPDMLEKTTRETLRAFGKAKEAGITLQPPSAKPHALAGLINIEIVPASESATGQAMVRTEVTIGRKMWIANMRHLLSGVAERLTRNQWSIVEPHGDMEWPLTDHPVLKLNYRGPDDYDFGGGWGNPHSELMMPLSPRHLLFTHVGKDLARRVTFPSQQTQLLRRLLVERAHRWVFAKRPQEWIVAARARQVDRKSFEDEEHQWATWHQDQTEAEVTR